MTLYILMDGYSHEEAPVHAFTSRDEAVAAMNAASENAYIVVATPNADCEELIWQDEAIRSAKVRAFYDRVAESNRLAKLGGATFYGTSFPEPATVLDCPVKA
jgi:hypothetical protein